MIISKSFYDKCCWSYRRALDRLERKLARYEERACKVKMEKGILALAKFSKNYLVPHEYWEYLMNIDSVFAEITARKIIGIIYAAHDNFYINIKFYNENYFILKMFDKDFQINLLDFVPKERLFLPWYNRLQITDEDCLAWNSDFTYPHSCLKECFQIYERSCFSPPSKAIVQQYEAMKELYQKIKAVESDTQEWFKLLLQTTDQFIRQNVEFRLGKNLLNSQLWKLYINYLEKVDTNKMLSVLSKYCKFFLSDRKMKRKFKKEMKNHGFVKSKWDSLFCFNAQTMVEDEEDVTESIVQKSDDEINNEESVEGENDDVSELVDNKVDNGCIDEKNDNEENVDGGKVREEDDVEKFIGEKSDGKEISNIIENDTGTEVIENSNSLSPIPMTDLNDPNVVENFVNLFQRLQKLLPVKTDNNYLIPRVIDSRISKKYFNIFVENQDFAFDARLISYILENANVSILRNLYRTCKCIYVKKQIPICYKMSKEEETAYKEESLVLTDSDAVCPKKLWLSTCLDLGSYPNVCHILPLIYKCDAKYIKLHYEDITFNDLKILIGRGNCVHLDSVATVTYENEDDFIVMEDLMKYLPRIEFLRFRKINVTKNTPQALLNINFKSKIHTIDCSDVTGETFDSHEFLKFCIKNRDPSRFDLTFGLVSKEFGVDFAKVMREYAVITENTKIR